MGSATHAYNHEHEEEGREGNGAEARTLEKLRKNGIHQLHSLSKLRARTYTTTNRKTTTLSRRQTPF